MQRWARAYRDDRYHAAVDTNNGVEAMNKTLKYNYLPKGKNITLSQLISVLIEQFLPEMLHKYQKQNFAMSELYRSYNEFVPEYLRGRPRAVILHCLSRIKKAAKFRAESIKPTNNDAGHFQVNSSSGKQHEVKISNGSGYPECTCKDWIRWHLPCKHLFAVFTFTKLEWSDLPSIYHHNEYLCADSAALNISLVKDGDCAFLPNSEGDNSQVCNVEDAIEYNHDLPKCKVSGNTSTQNTFMNMEIYL